MSIVLLVVLVVWVIPAMLGARMGRSRIGGASGSFVGFLVGLGFSWLGILILALEDRLPTRANVAARRDPTLQLKRLAELRDSGVINDEEFEAKRAELLQRI